MASVKWSLWNAHKRNINQNFNIMSIFTEMKNIKGKVEYLLKKNPALRDDDSKLIATYWWHEMGKEKTQLMTGYDFLDTFSRGILTSQKSISRVRIKLQEDNESLRGKSYNGRMKAEKEVRGNIKGL